MRAAHTKCDECGREMSKARAIRNGKAYCDACHKRLSKPVPCRECGKTVRIHAAGDPLCKSCSAKGRTCLRCGKPIVKAGLTVDGGVVCSPCARHYHEPRLCAVCGSASIHLSRDRRLGFDQPACPKCRRSDHATCSCCGKHRLPAGYDHAGRPLCRHCLKNAGTPFICPLCGHEGKRHSASRCVDCYWSERLSFEVDALAGQLSNSDLRASLPGYAAFLAGRRRPLAATLLFRRHCAFFLELDLNPSLLCDGSLLLTRFGADDLRRRALPYGYLAQIGLLERPDSSEIERHIEHRQQTMLISQPRPDWKTKLLRDFQQRLHDQQSKLVARGWSGRFMRLNDRTVTGYLRGAAHLLDSLSADLNIIQQLDQVQLDCYLVSYPGRLNPLRRFVRYLNQHGRLFEPLLIPRSRRPLVQLGNLLPPERIDQLLDRWQSGEPNPTHALLLLCIALYAQPVQRLVRMRLSQVIQTPDGGYLIRFAKTPIRLPDQLAHLLQLHLETMTQQTNDDIWLFPGRHPGRHLSEAALTCLLQREGVSQPQLFTTALIYSFVFGAQIPKSLTYAFGVSPITAVNYQTVLSVRLAREAAKRART